MFREILMILFVTCFALGSQLRPRCRALAFVPIHRRIGRQPLFAWPRLAGARMSKILRHDGW